MDERTKSDSLQLYLTGADSDGGAQTDPNESYGKYRSSTAFSALSFATTGNISNITIVRVAGANGVGAGSLIAESADTLSWTPPAGTKGTAVTIANGETKMLRGADTDKYIIVTRDSAANLSGTDTITLAGNYNNLWADITSAQAASGVTKYRALMIKNEASSAVNNIKVSVAELATQATTDSENLPASGAGTIETTDSFSDWALSGYAEVRESDGTVRERVYYSSRTGTELTVPATGRGLLETSEAEGAATDTVHSVPGMLLAAEDPTDSTPDQSLDNPADDETAPDIFSTGEAFDNEVDIGNLDADEMYGIWFVYDVPEACLATTINLGAFEVDFDAA